uniref:Uncharacterized protein n=1 Tax=Arundo donax TaxID=35708 RepID=A0A0A9FE57_ARUDO
MQMQQRLAQHQFWRSVFLVCTIRTSSYYLFHSCFKCNIYLDYTSIVLSNINIFLK